MLDILSRLVRTSKANLEGTLTLLRDTLFTLTPWCTAVIRSLPEIMAYNCTVSFAALHLSEGILAMTRGELGEDDKVRTEYAIEDAMLWLGMCQQLQPRIFLRSQTEERRSRLQTAKGVI